MSHILNPYYVYVDSSNRISGTDSNFSYSIPLPPLPGSQRYTHVTVLDALVPKSYFLVQAGLNTFQLSENGTTVTLSMPVGNYTLAVWETTIQSVLNAGSPNGYTYNVTFPSVNVVQTGMLTYTVNSTNPISLTFNQFLYEPFGFPKNSTNSFVGGSLTSTTVIKLQSEDRIFITSSLVANPFNDSVLVAFNASANVNFSSITYINYCPEYNTKILASSTNGIYNFCVTNESFTVLNTNGLNICMSLLFFTMNPLYDKIELFLRMMTLKEQHKIHLQQEREQLTEPEQL